MSVRLRLHAAPATLLMLAVVAALTVVGLLTLSGAEAANKQPKCGDTITADTTLREDLVNCPNNGIVIGADDITLDLNGHTVAGDGEQFRAPDFGIVNDGHNGVTIRDGAVRDFDVGVGVFAARRNRMLEVSSSRNVFFGFVLGGSARSLIRASSGSRNPAPDGDGLGLFSSHDIRIVDNAFRHNELGIHVSDSTDNLIKGNLLSRNPGPALIMEGDRNRVRGNRFVRNGEGILVGPANRNVIARNHLAEDEIAIEKGRGNLVARNVVVDAPRDGILLGLQHPLIGGANNIVRRNLVRGSGDDGFAVNEKDDHSLLKRNVARGARDDGFDIEGRETTVTRNRAIRNSDLGIAAVRGTSDGGGNRASGNGDGRQCVNVRCH